MSAKKLVASILALFALVYFLFFYELQNQKEASDLKKTQALNVFDCTLSVGGEYTIITSPDDSTILLKPKYLSYQIYHINFFNEQNRTKYIEHYMKQTGKGKYEMTNYENLEICKAPVQIDDIQTDSYTVFGKTFFILFSFLDKNAKKLLDSCNNTWKH